MRQTPVGGHRALRSRKAGVGGAALAAALVASCWAVGSGGPATAVTASTAVTGVQSVSAAGSPHTALTREQRLAGYVNAARKAHGLRAFTVSTSLSKTAEQQARWMAEHQTLKHNPNLTADVKGWSYLGENVAYNYGTYKAHQALMNSAPHRANLLSTQFTQIGLGVVKDSHGRVWVCEVFRRPA